MLSRLVITFFPRSKRLLISWLQSPSAVILEPKRIKSDTVSTVSPSISHEVMGPDAMILVFWMLSFKLTFSFSFFTFINRLFSSSLPPAKKKKGKRNWLSPAAVVLIFGLLGSGRPVLMSLVINDQSETERCSPQSPPASPWEMPACLSHLPRALLPLWRSACDHLEAPPTANEDLTRKLSLIWSSTSSQGHDMARLPSVTHMRL